MDYERELERVCEAINRIERQFWLIFGIVVFIGWVFFMG